MIYHSVCIPVVLPASLSLPYFSRSTFFQSTNPCLLGPITSSDVHHPFHRRCHKENVAKWGLGTRKCQKKKKDLCSTSSCLQRVPFTCVEAQGSHLPGWLFLLTPILVLLPAWTKPLKKQPILHIGIGSWMSRRKQRIIILGLSFLNFGWSDQIFKDLQNLIN